MVDTSKNQRLFLRHAKHAASQLITYRGVNESSVANGSSSKGNSTEANLIELNSWSNEFKVSGLTHVSIHQSLANPHYGIDGDYRNCGSGGPRPRADVKLCQQADTLWLGPWNQTAPDKGPYGLSTFNPDYSNMAQHILRFLDKSSPAAVTEEASL